MAIRNINEGTSQWNSKMPFNKDTYIMRCIEESFGPSKGSGNPMITRKWEITSPETIQVGDKKVSVVGCSFLQYLTTKVIGADGTEDVAKSDSAFGRLRDDYQALGYTGEGIDTDNPELIAKGKLMYAILYGKPQEKFGAPTPEDVAQGKKVGAPIKDPVTGKALTTYQIQIDTILSEAPQDPTKPY